MEGNGLDSGTVRNETSVWGSVSFAFGFSVFLSSQVGFFSSGTRGWNQQSGKVGVLVVYFYHRMVDLAQHPWYCTVSVKREDTVRVRYCMYCRCETVSCPAGRCNFLLDKQSLQEFMHRVSIVGCKCKPRYSCPSLRSIVLSRCQDQKDA